MKFENHMILFDSIDKRIKNVNDLLGITDDVYTKLNKLFSIFNELINIPRLDEMIIKRI